MLYGTGLKCSLAEKFIWWRHIRCCWLLGNAIQTQQHCWKRCMRSKVDHIEKSTWFGHRIEPATDCLFWKFWEPKPISVTLCVLLDRLKGTFGTYKLNVLISLWLLLLCMIFTRRLQVQSWLLASNNTGILSTYTRLWLTESEQATSVD